MKIGILTFHHSLNCGAALQAWALQSALRKLGFDARIVNYGKIGWEAGCRFRCDTLRHLAGSLYSAVKTFVLTFGVEAYRRRLYRRFMRRQMGLGRQVSKADVLTGDFTHLVVGSDQVWHPCINEGDDVYFLAGASAGVRRIAYAPSFGVDAFDADLERKMSGWLSRFDALSVREPQGAEIVRRLCGREASVVCDPTLLLPQSDYEAVERRPHFAVRGKYVAVYTVCGHPWAEKAALEIGGRMGLPVVHLPGGQPARWYGKGDVRRVSALGPAEWLWFIRHADFVVTNSFHGTVFSLLFHRPFLVAANNVASDARMQTLLAGTGCEPRLVRAEGDALPTEEPDWRRVDVSVKHQAETGCAYIRSALKGMRKGGEA